MYIKSIYIKDFQAHADSTIELDKNVTALVGLNNHGKSAVLKALRKVIRNKPDGNIFIRNIPKNFPYSSVKIITNEDNIIERRVGQNLTSSSNNMYKVKLNSGEEFEFTKFARTGIPEEVLKAMSISPPQTFGNVDIDLNFHIQQDNIFLIKGEGLSSLRSKVLSRITGVDRAQRAIQIGNAKEKSLTQDLNRERVQKQGYLTDLEKYKDLDEVIEETNHHIELVSTLNKLQDNLIYYKACLVKLQNIISSAHILTNKISCLSLSIDISSFYNYSNIIKHLKKVKEVSYSLNTSTMLVSILKEHIDLSRIKTLVEVLQILKKIKSIVDRYNKLSQMLNISILNIQPILEHREKVALFKQYLDKNISILKSMMNKENNIIDVSKKEILVKKELQELKEELKTCPVCEKPF
jgi:energy-coupling factor transporter ATP-binding protein EcfA2